MISKDSIPSKGRKPRRFFSSEPLESIGQSIYLSVPETRHLREVLRLQKGDKCLLTDGRGKEAEARIEENSAEGRARLVLEQLTVMKAESSMLTLHLYPALLQKGKIDGLVEKAQELAVQAVHPMETRHTVLKLNENSRAKVLSRWNKIAREAAKQSGSSRLVCVEPPQSFEKAIAGIPSGERAVLFHPCKEAVKFSEWVSTVSPGEVLHLLIGPEGGFSDDEAEAFLRLSGRRDVIVFGETLLKADTAFIGVVAALRFLFYA